MANKNYNNEELIRLYRTTQEEEYLQQLVESNKCFIYYYRNYAFERLSKDKKLFLSEQMLGLETDDIIQAGYLGLLKALKKYREDKGVKFLTYAAHYVGGEIMDCIKKEICYKSRTQSLDDNTNFEFEIDAYYILLKYDVENMIHSTLDTLEEQVILLHYGFIQDREYSVEEINQRLKISNAKYVIQKSLKKLRKTEAAKEYRREFYQDKLKANESQNINPEIKVIKKICFEEILENL